MNKNISKGKFDLFNAIKYINKNEKSKPFILRDIQNQVKSRLYKQFSPQPEKTKNKINLKYNFSSVSSSSTKTNITEREMPNNKNIINSFKNEENNNCQYKHLNTESDKLEDNIIQNNNLKIIENRIYKHKRNNSYVTKLNKNINNLDNINFNNENKKKQDYSNNKLIKGRNYSNSSKKSLLNYSLFISNLIKIEDILLISQRIEVIYKKINCQNILYDEGVSQECFEYWIFYFNSSLPENYTSYFSNVHHVIVKSSNNLELFTIILAYHLSLNSKTYKNYKMILGEIFPLIKKNFLLIIRKLINEIYEKEDEMFLSNNQIYLNKINEILNDNNQKEKYEKEIISNIIDNSKLITEYIKIILTQYQNDNKINGKELIILFNNLSKLPNKAINEFFFDKIFHIGDKEGSITNIIKLNNISNINKIKVPYITNPLKKKYSLVLDLDETLILVKLLNNTNKGVLHFRPYLFEFLNTLFPLYELILFTTSTHIYADRILNEIEFKKKYFSYKFYREHSIIKGKEIIKDISRIGRNMKKILIVDNNLSNFKVNQENGILIFPFYNEKNKDSSLLELKKILLKIYYKNYEDLREAIKDFKNDIIMKVSLPD